MILHKLNAMFDHDTTYNSYYDRFPWTEGTCRKQSHQLKLDLPMYRVNCQLADLCWVG